MTDFAPVALRLGQPREARERKTDLVSIDLHAKLLFVAIIDEPSLLPIELPDLLRVN